MAKSKKEMADQELATDRLTAGSRGGGTADHSLKKVSLKAVRAAKTRSLTSCREGREFKENTKD